MNVLEWDRVFLSDLAGYVGLACWFVVMTPQIYTNWKLRNASSLSPGYVIMGLLGNFSSFLGSILAGLIFTSILVTGYLSLLGAVLLFQIWLYQPKEDDMSQYIQWRVKDPSQPRTRSVSIRSRLSFLPEYEPVLSLPKHLEDLKQSTGNENLSDLPSNAVPINSIYNSINEYSNLLSSSYEAGSNHGHSVGPSLGNSFGPNYYGSNLNGGSVRSGSIMSQRDSIASVPRQRINSYFARPDSIISEVKNASRRMSVMSTFTYPPTAPPPSPQSQKRVITLGVVVVAALIALAFTFTSPTAVLPSLPIPIPQALGWLSGIMFMFSRASQIQKNYARRSVEGLSGLMFGLGILGNINYLLALLLFSTEPSYLQYNLPWLVSSSIGLSLDFAVVIQFILYADNTIPYDLDEVEIDQA